MRARTIHDTSMRCLSCGQQFVLSAGEQELCALRGGHHSGACPTCARRLRLPTCVAQRP